MRNSDVAEKFVNGAIKGRTQHLIIDKNILLSYGWNFIVAIRLNSDEGFKFILNKRGYSISTSGHKGCVRSLIDEKDIILETERIEDFENMKDVKELKKIAKTIKKNLKIIKEMGLKEGYLLRNKTTGRIVKINHIHPIYGWVNCQDDELKQDYGNIKDFEIAYKEMIAKSL